jgi:hypothetical protein
VIAGLARGAQRVEGLTGDVGDIPSMAAMLGRLDPAVIVLGASRHTWWRTPDALRALPYGALLPLHVGLARDMMRARDESGSRAPVVALPYPDAVGPVLAPLGLAPEVGAGNVSEIAAKLETLCARDHDVRREDVDVRLIAHHSVERVAFAAFSELGGGETSIDPGPPPWRAEVTVSGAPVEPDRVREWFREPYPLLSGRQTHMVTATAACAVVEALLLDVPQRVHVPAPDGRPGGYPARLSSRGIALDLPDSVPESEAVAINATAARWDGIEQIDAHGTITFTRDVADTTSRVLGWPLERIAVEEIDAVTAELEARLRAAAG